MSDPNDLTAFLELAWQHLRHGVADSQSPARHPTFATVSPDGLPELRTVALRRVSQAQAMVEVHTDIVTPKVQSLRAFPKAGLHVWLPKADLQIRLTTHVDILTGEAVEDLWAEMPQISRVSYGTSPDPGTPIESVFTYSKPAVRERFAVLQCHINCIGVVELGAHHRRAEFTRDTEWRGVWLAP